MISDTQFLGKFPLKAVEVGKALKDRILIITSFEENEDDGNENENYDDENESNNDETTSAYDDDSDDNNYENDNVYLLTSNSDELFSIPTDIEITDNVIEKNTNKIEIEISTDDENDSTTSFDSFSTASVSTSIIDNEKFVFPTEFWDENFSFSKNEDDSNPLGRNQLETENKVIPYIF